MDKYDINHLTAKPIALSPEFFSEDGDVSQFVIVPEPTINIAQGCGFDVYDFEDQDEVISSFKSSYYYSDWRNSLIPSSIYLHPCEVDEEKRSEVSVELQTYGLPVVLVSEDSARKRPSGFMLIGGGKDLSADLAKAYILAGYVPPLTILMNALENTRETTFRPEFVQAARQANDHLTYLCEKLQEHIEPTVISGLSP